MKLRSRKKKEHTIEITITTNSEQLYKMAVIESKKVLRKMRHFLAGDMSYKVNVIKDDSHPEA